MNPRNPVTSFANILSPPADVEGEVTWLSTATSDYFIETTGSAVRVTELNVAHYRHKDVLTMINQIKDLDIALRKISDVHVLFLVKST